jgi:hypothetical protein
VHTLFALSESNRREAAALQKRKATCAWVVWRTTRKVGRNWRRFFYFDSLQFLEKRRFGRIKPNKSKRFSLVFLGFTCTPLALKLYPSGGASNCARLLIDLPDRLGRRPGASPSRPARRRSAGERTRSAPPRQSPMEAQPAKSCAKEQLSP